MEIQIKSSPAGFEQWQFDWTKCEASHRSSVKGEQSWKCAKEFLLWMFSPCVRCSWPTFLPALEKEKKPQGDTHIRENQY